MSGERRRFDRDSRKGSPPGARHRSKGAWGQRSSLHSFECCRARRWSAVPRKASGRFLQNSARRTGRQRVVRWHCSSRSNGRHRAAPVRRSASQHRWRDPRMLGNSFMGRSALLLGIVMTLAASGASGCTEHKAPSRGALGHSGDGGAVTAALPEVVLASIVGCWQLEDRERWTILRTGANGARVVRTLLADPGLEGKGAYVKRAALPAEILFDAAERTLAFSTAGPVHALLFVFTVDAQELQGSWATSRAPGSGYRALPGRVSLHRSTRRVMLKCSVPRFAAPRPRGFAAGRFPRPRARPRRRASGTRPARARSRRRPCRSR